MQEAVPVGTGAMAAILGLDAATVAAACDEASHGDVVSAANLNGGGQVVISGARDAVARAGARAKELGARRVIPLQVSAPFHCALMKPAQDRLAPELRSIRAHDPRVPIIANVDAATQAHGVGRDRGAHCPGLVAGPLGGRRASPCVGRRHNVC